MKASTVKWLIATVIALVAAGGGGVAWLNFVKENHYWPFRSSLNTPRKVVRVCMGNGGGDNCLSGADAHYDCDAYKAMGGGNKETLRVLAERFCGYSDNGDHNVYEPKIIVYQNNKGGECGWTGFQVTCY